MYCTMAIDAKLLVDKADSKREMREALSNLDVQLKEIFLKMDLAPELFGRSFSNHAIAYGRKTIFILDSIIQDFTRRSLIRKTFWSERDEAERYHLISCDPWYAEYPVWADEWTNLTYLEILEALKSVVAQLEQLAHIPPTTPQRAKMLNLTRLQDVEHAPFCRYCWKESEAYTQFKHGGFDCSKPALKPSRLFCEDHNPQKNPTLYRWAKSNFSTFVDHLESVRLKVRTGEIGSLTEREAREIALELTRHRVKGMRKLAFEAYKNACAEQEVPVYAHKCASTQQLIAEELGISQQTISKAKSNIPWKLSYYLLR